ncbi:MAG: ISL3 family transposase [Deltaproteobacteria bacterium]|nr:ISL3 family transposase [Deltaproteobacteria bacterium]
MNTIFEAALSINKPCYIKNVEFDPDKKQLDLYVDFKRGSTFKVDEPGYDGSYKVYDTVDKTWRHLNFFQHECYLHCRTLRIKYDKDKIKQIDPPWAGKSPGFTLLFEALVIKLCTYMPVNTVCGVIKENKNKIWRMLEKYVDMTQEHEDFSDVTVVGMDETSRAKGHDYVTLFVDLKKRRTTFVAEGKDHKTVEAFADDLKTQRETLEELQLSKLRIKSVRALRIRESFQDIYHAETEDAFSLLLNKWYFWATHSRLEPI